MHRFCTALRVSLIRMHIVTIDEANKIVSFIFQLYIEPMLLQLWVSVGDDAHIDIKGQ